MPINHYDLFYFMYCHKETDIITLTKINSDSPSPKSKGVRLVSAKHELNHSIDKGKVF